MDEADSIPGEEQIGAHYFDDRNNVLYDLIKDTVVHLWIKQTIPGAEGEPETERLYSIAEIHTGILKKLYEFQIRAENASDRDSAEKKAEKDQDLVLVSFYSFLASPGVSAVLTGFHNAWLHGFYAAKLLKNRKLVVSSARSKMTSEERTFAKEKIRDEGLVPYDPQRHGSGEETPGQSASD